MVGVFFAALPLPAICSASLYYSCGCSPVVSCDYCDQYVLLHSSALHHALATPTGNAVTTGGTTSISAGTELFAMSVQHNKKKRETRQFEGTGSVFGDHAASAEVSTRGS
jgi:hypothetical protein